MDCIEILDAAQLEKYFERARLKAPENTRLMRVFSPFEKEVCRRCFQQALGLAEKPLVRMDKREGE